MRENERSFIELNGLNVKGKPLRFPEKLIAIDKFNVN